MKGIDRFYLKMWTIGFEVPYDKETLDTNDPEGQVELANNISNRYLDWFDCVHVEIATSELHNQNQLILFHIIVRVDTESGLTDEMIEADWDKMKVDLQSYIEKFLNDRKVDYRVVYYGRL